MVSKFSYWSGKELNMRGRIPWVYAALIPLIYVDRVAEPRVAVRPVRRLCAVGAAVTGCGARLSRKKRVADGAA